MPGVIEQHKLAVEDAVLRQKIEHRLEPPHPAAGASGREWCQPRRGNRRTWAQIASGRSNGSARRTGLIKVSMAVNLYQRIIVKGSIAYVALRRLTSAGRLRAVPTRVRLVLP
jgi:hypothetical protein